MLGGPTLQACASHDAAGGITAVDYAAGLLAVGQREGPTLLFSDGNFGAVIELPLDGNLHDGTCTLAFSLAGDVLLLGSRDGALFRLAFTGQGTQLAVVPLEQTEDPAEPCHASISSIVRQHEGDIFAVATGRCIYVLDASGVVHTKIGPLQEPVLQLSWVDSTTLVGATADAIHTWPRNASQLGPVLRNLSAAPYLLFATSPDSRHLAVASAAREVQCWELGAVLESEATHVAEPVHLDDYEAPVVCLEWDPQSRYLATSDGPDVTIWDLSDGSTGGKAASIACCGHEQSTRVVRMAFCPEGNLLATASDSAKIVLFNVQQFRKGGVAGPVAVAALDAQDEEVTALRWLPGSRLLAGTATGKVCVYQVGPDPSLAAAVPQPITLPPLEAAVEAAGAHAAEHPQGGAGGGSVMGNGGGPGVGSSLPDSFAQMSLAGRQPKAVRTTPPLAASPAEGPPPPAAVAPSSAAAAGVNNPRQRPGMAGGAGPPGPPHERGVRSPRQDPYGGLVGPAMQPAGGGVGVGALPPAVAAALGLPPPQVYFTPPPRRAPAAAAAATAANGLASSGALGEGYRGQSQNGNRRRQQGQQPHSHAAGGGAYPGAAYNLEGVSAAGLALPSYGSAGEGPRTPANVRGDQLGELHSGPPQQGHAGGAGGGWGGGGAGGRQHGGAAASGVGGGRRSSSGSGGSLSPSAAAARTSPFALVAAAAAAVGYQQQQHQQQPGGTRSSPALHRAGSGGGGPSRFGNGGGAAGGSAGGAGAPGAQGYGGMSSSLMQHIQAVRENPPQGGRGDGHHHHHQQQQRRQELAGWGAGQPGGATSLPWMVVMPPGAAPVAAGAAPMPMQGLSPFPGSPAQAQQMYAAQYHAAMMQRMAQGGQHLMPQVQFVQAPAGGLPTSPRAMPAASQAAAAMLAVPPMSPAATLQPAAAMLTHTPAGPYMIPYMQQWPGAPPMAAFPGGYMTFPAAPAGTAINPAYMAAAMQAASRTAQPQPPASPAAAPGAAYMPGAGQQGFPPRGGRPQRQPSLPQAGGPYAQQPQQQVPPPPQGRGSSEGAYGGTPPPRRKGSLQRAGSGLPPTPPGGSRAAAHPPPEEPRPAGPAVAASPRRAAAPTPAGAVAPAPPQSALEKRFQEGDRRAGGMHEAAARCNSAAAAEAAAGFSPTAVLEARGDAGSSVAPTPGGSAGDVHSVQGSTQRGSLDLPLSPMDRTSPRLSLGITGGGTTAPGPGAAAVAAAVAAGAAGRGRPGHLNRRGSGDVGVGEAGRKDEVAAALARHLSSSGSMPDSPASPTNEVVTVYVGNLPAAVDEYTLACTFMHFGPVVHVQIIRDKATLVSKGFGFVTFAHPAYATLAMQQMDQQVLYGPFGGLRIKVAPSKQGMGPGGSVPSTPQHVRSMFPQQQ
ncbi:hypothetical protein N2152v2_005319 [Parachlorella kessleri]